LRLLCAAEDIELEVVWRPREDPHQKVRESSMAALLEHVQQIKAVSWCGMCLR